MKVNEAKNVLNTTLALLLTTGLLMGCAKDLPEDVSDDIKETAHSLNLFKNSVEVETVEEDGIMALSSKDSVSDIIAVNELGLRTAVLKTGPSELLPFFEQLKIESSHPGQKFTVHFSFTSSALIAYVEVKDQKLTLIQEQLSENIKTYGGKTVRAYPVFQYPVQAFGTLGKAENSLGEETRTVVFEPKSMNNATHIKIDPKVEKRNYAAFRFDELDEEKVVFNKAKLSQRLFKTKDIVNLFTYSTAMEASSDFKEDDFLKITLLKNQAIIQKPVKRSELNQLEVAALDSGQDPRIKACDKRTAQAAKLKLSECILSPRFSVNLKHIKLKKKFEEGVLLAQMDAPSEVSNQASSKLVELNLDSRLTDAQIGKDINNTDEILTSKDKHFDTEAEYLYVPMTMGTPREVIAADPFYQGKEKIVKMRFAKDGLEIYELEKDDRFTDNDLNNTPVLKIPGAHIDYKCKEDENDECVGGDQEDTDKEWKEKRFFKPTLESLSVLEINPLDIMTVEASGCLQKVETALVGYTIKKGVLNIELEKTYKTNNSWKCIRDNYFADTENLTGFSQAGFKVRFFYSVVKLDSIASSDYEPVAYPIPDHDEFGFFKDKISKLSDDFDSRRKDNNYRLSRWNPKKGKVVYHLSDTFNKPKNKLIKDATYKAFEGMNRALKMANAGIQLELKEPSGKKAGDLRNSMIVLIDDPLSNGLLGYAPTVTNPRTGEIVQGHVNMYSGVLTSIVRHNWEGMVDFTIAKKEEKNKEIKIELAPVASSEDKGDQSDKEGLLKKIGNKALIQKALSGGPTKSSLFSNFYHFIDQSKFSEKIARNAQKAEQAMERRLREKYVWSRQDIEYENDEEDHLIKLAQKKEERLRRFAENNALSEEAYKIAHTTKALIPGIKEIAGVFKEDGTLKRWKDLTKEQRKQATDIILPYTYTATLVHEVGHGLGLRHNFIASKDAANYWTEEEAQALGLEHAPAYSSVMDYAFDTLNESTMFGKYDIAALRFGYAREVELERSMTGEETELPDGVKAKEVIKVDSTLYELSKKLKAENDARAEEAGEGGSYVKEDLRGYQFCTDSNAGLSASCNRFDEGSTLVEIANHYISKYKTYYKYRNFRDGRNTFQAEGLEGYAAARLREFDRIRGIFEEWEFFAGIFGEDIMIQGCGPAELAMYPICKDINDRKDAVEVVGNFFLEVLKTPDLTCALAKPEAPNQIVEFKTLHEIYDDLKFSIPHVTTTCFDPAVKDQVAGDGFIVVAEAGKFLNGFKDNSPIHIYSNDRAVRGVWVDKVMAIKALLQRKSGRPITESTHKAIVDHRAIAPKVGNFLRHLLLGDKLIEPVKFKTEAGQEFEIDYSIGLDYVVDGPQRALKKFKKSLGLPESGDAKLVEVLLKNAKKYGLTQDEDHGQDSHDIVNLFTVRKYQLGESRDLTDLNYILLNDTFFAANETNALANIMLQSFKSLDFLQQVDPEMIVKVVKNRISPELPADLSPEEVIAIKIDDALLNALLQAANQGADLPLAFFIERFGEELGTQLHTAYGLGAEGLAKVIEIKAGLGQAPDLASEVEKKLYDLELDILKEFIDGSLEKKVELYQQTLPYMPSMVNFR